MIRVNYFMALGPGREKVKGTKYKVIQDKNYNWDTKGKERLIVESNITQINFNNFINFDSKFKFTLFPNEKFDNSHVKIRIFHSNETDDSLYSNMTFKDMYEWDEFYYSSNTI